MNAPSASVACFFPFLQVSVRHSNRAAPPYQFYQSLRELSSALIVPYIAVRHVLQFVSCFTVELTLNTDMARPIGSVPVESTLENNTSVGVMAEKRRASVADIPIYNELELVDRTQMSFGDVLKGTAAKPMDAFEKKAALINVELDKMGFGRYQWCIWFLCGFGYFLDLAWAQGVGLGASAIFQQMNVPDKDQGNIWSCANAGLAIGALGWGLAVDVIGRRWAFNLTCLITSVFGLILAAPTYNYGAVCGIYFLACLGLGGNIPIDATIALEFIPQSKRNLVSLLSLWQPVGVVFASAVAYGTAAKYRCPTTTPALPGCNGVASGVACCTPASNMGWRYEFIVLGGVTLFIFFLRYFVFHFHESPKFLVSRGRDAEAIDVLQKIAKFNKAPMPTLTIEQFQEIDKIHGGGFVSAKEATRNVLGNFVGCIRNLKGLFSNYIQIFTFFLLALAYMVSVSTTTIGLLGTNIATNG